MLQVFFFYLFIVGMGLVEQICNRVGIIDNGRLLREAAIDELAQKAKGKSLEDIYFEITGKGGDLA